MEQKVKKIMSQIFRVAEDHIREDASSLTIDSWDSLAHMNLIAALEEEFGVQFQDQEIIQMTSFEAILSSLALKAGSS